MSYALSFFWSISHQWFPFSILFHPGPALRVWFRCGPSSSSQSEYLPTRCLFGVSSFPWALRIPFQGLPTVTVNSNTVMMFSQGMAHPFPLLPDWFVFEWVPDLNWTDLHILRLEYKFIVSDQRICLEFNVILQLMYLFLSFCLKMCHCCEDIFFKLWVKGLNDFSCFSFKVVEILKLRYFFEMFLFYFISL